MKKAPLVAILAVAAVAFMTPQKAAACDQCKFALVCYADTCDLVQYCQGQAWGRKAYSDCEIDQFGTCRTGSDFCVWTLNLTPVEIRPDLACHEASS